MNAPPGTDSGHQSPCSRCGVTALVPISETRLETRPWRFIWICSECEQTSTRAVPRVLVGSLVEMFDRAGGSIVSRREVREFERLEMDLFEEFVIEEIYLEA